MITSYYTEPNQLPVLEKELWRLQRGYARWATMTQLTREWNDISMREWMDKIYRYNKRIGELKTEIKKLREDEL